MPLNIYIYIRKRDKCLLFLLPPFDTPSYLQEKNRNIESTSDRA